MKQIKQTKNALSTIKSINNESKILNRTFYNMNNEDDFTNKLYSLYMFQEFHVDVNLDVSKPVYINFIFIKKPVYEKFMDMVITHNQLVIEDVIEGNVIINNLNEKEILNTLINVQAIENKGYSLKITTFTNNETLIIDEKSNRLLTIPVEDTDLTSIEIIESILKK